MTDGIGGVEGATGNSFTAYGDYISYLNTQYGLSLADLSSQDVMNLASDDLAFNQALVADELAFNQNLITEELAAESAAFGGNESALNGVVDRVINIDNLYLATGESSVNDVLRANYSPAELTASVLTGDTGYTVTDPTTVFGTRFRRDVSRLRRHLHQPVLIEERSARTFVGDVVAGLMQTRGVGILVLVVELFL